MNRRPSLLQRFPLLVVEDHLSHIDDLLSALSQTAPTILASLQVLCLQRSGLDTCRSVQQWLQQYTDLHVAADVEPAELTDAGVRQRLIKLDQGMFTQATDYCRHLAWWLRPGGLLVQDIQLNTLSFLPRQRWWESIYLATTVRGMFQLSPPRCLFVSNKRGYQATFGAELVEAGFDPHDVLEKRQLDTIVVPELVAYVTQQFPLRLEFRDAEQPAQSIRLSDTAEEFERLTRELDLAIWHKPDGSMALGGQAIASPTHRLDFRDSSAEALTWSQLIRDRIDHSAGLAVVEVGQRLAPQDAQRAERTNAAARHIHRLRGRLFDRGQISTYAHKYRLTPNLRVGWVGPA